MRQEQQNLQLQTQQYNAKMALEAKTQAEEVTRDQNEDNYRQAMLAQQVLQNKRLENESIATRNLAYSKAVADGDIEAVPGVVAPPPSPTVTAAQGIIQNRLAPTTPTAPTASPTPTTPSGIPPQSAIGQPGQPTTLPSQQAGAQVPLGAGLPPQLQQAAQQAASTVQGNPLAPPGQPPPSFGPATSQVASNGQRFVGPTPNLAQTPQGQPVSNPSGAQPALPTQQPPVVAPPATAQQPTAQRPTFQGPGGQFFAAVPPDVKAARAATAARQASQEAEAYQRKNTLARLQQFATDNPDSEFAKDPETMAKVQAHIQFGIPFEQDDTMDKLEAHYTNKFLSTVNNPRVDNKTKADAITEWNTVHPVFSQYEKDKSGANAQINQGGQNARENWEAGDTQAVRDRAAAIIKAQGKDPTKMTTAERNTIVNQAGNDVAGMLKITRPNQPIHSKAISNAMATEERGIAENPKSTLGGISIGVDKNGNPTFGAPATSK